MRIALVNPRTDSFSSVMPPLGLLYVAAALERDGFDVRVFDPLPGDDAELAAAEAFQPDVVGLSLLTAYVPRATEILARLRKSLPRARFVAGGVHATVLPEQTMAALPLDYLVLGEGERTMSELCRAIERNEPVASVRGLAYRGPLGVLRTASREPEQDLDSLPPPARHLLDFDRYLFPPGMIRGHWSERSTTAMTSRGCPYHCIWCGTQSVFGRKVRRRSVANVVAELKDLVERYRVDSVWFCDDTFTVNPKWTLDFCDALEKSGLRLTWGCQAHVHTVEEGVLRRMKQVGLVQLDIGVESGSNRVLKALKKESSADAIREAFRVAKKVGVRTLATFVFGSPDERQEDVEETYRLAREVKPDFVSSYFLTPFPGTELMDLAQRNAWIKEIDYSSQGLKKRPPMLIHFSHDELVGIRARFQRAFIARNYMSLLKNPALFGRAVLLMARYPRGVWNGVKAFARSRVFDDFTFAFLMYYASVKQRGRPTVPVPAGQA